jgi:hypothetical protein
MPHGAILAGRVDDEHWLTCGTGGVLPVLFGKHPVLMARGRVEAPVRLGVFLPAAAAGAAEVGAAAEKPVSGPAKQMATGPFHDTPRIGWAALPAGHQMCLRMSGLLWPEAAHRLANAAWVTREGLGKGQVILFAAPPAFRASTLGMARVLHNALIYGPGLGTTQPVR